MLIVAVSVLLLNTQHSVQMDGTIRPALAPHAPTSYIATEFVILVEFRKKCLKIQQ